MGRAGAVLARAVLTPVAKIGVVVFFTIVAIGNGLLKKFLPFGNRLRSTRMATTLLFTSFLANKSA